MESLAAVTNFHSGFQMLFYFLVIFFMIHAVVLAYHWKNFGDSKKVTVSALAVYLMGGAILFLAFAFSIYNI